MHYIGKAEHYIGKWERIRLRGMRNRMISSPREGSQMVRFLIPKKNEWTEKEKGGFIFLCGLQTTNYVISYQGTGARSAPEGR